VWVSNGRLGGDAWPAGQLPPPSQPAPVAARPSAMGEPGLGGLLVSFADALGGQRLAQPGMLVLHVIPLSSLMAAVLLKAALSSAVAGRW
jgi:hypothetical protein